MPKIGWTAARGASFALYYSGGLRVFERLDRGRRPSPRCTVLSYHRVTREIPGYLDIAVAPRTFRDHLEYLVGHGLGFLSLEEYHEYLAGRRLLERDSVVITFDDGYRDNYAIAFPILRELGVPAAVFLCTGPIDTGIPLWWDRVARAVRSLRDGDGSPRTADVPPDLSVLLRRALVGGDRAASRAISGMVDMLKERPEEARESVIVALESETTLDADGDCMLTWDMVREMRAAGIGFGAHSVTHPAFSRLTPEAATSEVVGSKKRIEYELGEEVTAFAYPYGKEGYFDEVTVAALRSAGLCWAYTTENGRNAPGADPLALRRDGMRDVPGYVLAARLAGVFEHPLLAGAREVLEGRRPPVGP